MKDKKEEQNESRRLNYKQPFMHHSHVQPFRSSLFLIYCIPFAIKKLASLNTVTDLKHLENTCHSQSHFNLKHVRVLRRLLVDLFISYFREGVSESQLAQVLSIELGQTIEACKWSPKFTVIVAQKNHHAKFFQSRSTVIDKGVCHPRNNYFYLCAHAGVIRNLEGYRLTSCCCDQMMFSVGLTYYCLQLGHTVAYTLSCSNDEIGFSADDLQEPVHSLSYFSEEVAAILLQPHDLVAVECWKRSTLLVNEVP
ncbi:hypothetical protein WN944_006855 [Citrus x changshan-huyou]|uniref:Piwi domain-containing protein n=1 Tax=Citrus x changshan-huyou TaxID=2935761 RepID=A0AAP0MRB5_9ROSI